MKKMQQILVKVKLDLSPKYRGKHRTYINENNETQPPKKRTSKNPSPRVVHVFWLLLPPGLPTSLRKETLYPHPAKDAFGHRSFTMCFKPRFQESYNTPQEHTPGNPQANYERNPFVACW